MGLSLFFWPNFPGAMFIQGATFIPDSRVTVSRTWAFRYSKLTVLFSGTSFFRFSEFRSWFQPDIGFTFSLFVWIIIEAITFTGPLLVWTYFIISYRNGTNIKRKKETLLIAGITRLITSGVEYHCVMYGSSHIQSVLLIVIEYGNSHKNFRGLFTVFYSAWANWIRIKSQSCNLQTGQFISNKYVNQFLLNLPHSHSKK